MERRLSQHQLGVGAGYTRIDAAFAREKQIQNWGRAKREALIDGRTADPPLLARNHTDPPR